MEAETGDTRVPCALCGVLLKNRKSLNTHRKQFHPETVRAYTRLHGKTPEEKEQHHKEKKAEADRHRRMRVKQVWQPKQYVLSRNLDLAVIIMSFGRCFPAGCHEPRWK